MQIIRDLAENIITARKEAKVREIQRLLETMTRIHIDTARGANPLSGLPGSVAIEEELNRRISENK